MQNFRELTRPYTKWGDIGGSSYGKFDSVGEISRNMVEMYKKRNKIKNL